MENRFVLIKAKVLARVGDNLKLELPHGWDYDCLISDTESCSNSEVDWCDISEAPQMVTPDGNHHYGQAIREGLREVLEKHQPQVQVDYSLKCTCGFYMWNKESWGKHIEEAIYTNYFTTGDEKFNE